MEDGARVPHCPFRVFSHILFGVTIVNPCELNALIAALTNYLYTTLSSEDFKCLSIFLNELSKSMFATTLFQGLCYREEKIQEDSSQ